MVAYLYGSRATSFACLIILLVSMAMTGQGMASYKISRGDVLNLVVIGAPDLATRAPVDADLQVALPIVGLVSLAGLDMVRAQSKIQSLLSGKQYRSRTAEGIEYPVTISANAVTLSLVEYSPIYMDGDVAKPGVEPYRPGLTVRKTVALAGGYDILRFKMENPFLQLADLSSEYQSLWINYAKQDLRIARLQAELSGGHEIDASVLKGLPVPRRLADDMTNNEQNMLATRDADTAKEQQYLRIAISKEEERSKILSEQQGKELEGVKADQNDLQRYSDLFQKGAVALPGLSDARRTVLLSSTRALQTNALLASVQREEGDLGRRLERVGDDRTMQLLKDLQDARTEQATLKASLQGVSEKLRYTGMVKSQLVGGAEAAPAITITRTVEGKPDQFEATLDTEVQPGDVVDVTLRAQALVPVQ